MRISRSPASSRLRLAAIAAAIVVGSSGVAAAAVIASPPTHTPAPVDRVHRFYVVGPWAEYTDFGQIGGVAPLRWEASGPATQTGVVEASFQYRTRGSGPFFVTFTVREVGGSAATIRPGAFTIAPAPKRAVTSVRFVVPQLSSGHTYEGEVGVNSQPPDGGVGTNKITTTKVVVTVELTDG